MVTLEGETLGAALVQAVIVPGRGPDFQGGIATGVDRVRGCESMGTTGKTLSGPGGAFAAGSLA